jgi:hypothetical protein
MNLHLVLVGRRRGLRESSITERSRQRVLLQDLPLMGVLRHHHKSCQDEAVMGEAF